MMFFCFLRCLILWFPEGLDGFLLGLDGLFCGDFS